MNYLGGVLRCHGLEGGGSHGDLEAGSRQAIPAKEARRRKLARLPFPEKVRAVVRLQEMAAPVFRARGKIVRVWALEDELMNRR
jgi:hypothetical protein